MQLLSKLNYSDEVAHELLLGMHIVCMLHPPSTPSSMPQATRLELSLPIAHIHRVGTLTCEIRTGLKSISVSVRLNRTNSEIHLEG